MDKRNLNKKDILNMIFQGQMTSEEGFELLNEINLFNSNTGFEKKFNSKNSYLNNSAFRGGGQSHEIAIIGMSGRFPGARNLNEFWGNLAAGTDSVKEVPSSRWDIDQFCDSDPKAVSKSYSKWAGLVSDVDKFDTIFFNITPREAELMDPQQRLFLEEAFHALEDAGYSDKDLKGKSCCVFVGCGGGDYQIKLKEENVDPQPYSFIGNASSILASRISYFLNLKGPSVAIDTACSSSLVAIHLACENILNGTSDLGIAGGVYISLTPTFHILASRSMMLSPEGKCKVFDQSADGFVPGEGVGVVVLKRLDKALEDGDHIYGVIKGSGINQDGKTNGITAPSGPSQTALEHEVYKKYQIHPETLSYVEAHGTGTKLGDPIEIEALTEAFGKYTDKKQFCAIGSVKSNIGHGLTAAGVASVIKVLLALKYCKIPASIHFNKSNEHIKFAESPFYVATELMDWKKDEDFPRRAAISSFGFSGTNCHMVIEEAPVLVEEDTGDGGPYYMIALSAKTDTALKRKSKDLENWLDGEGQCHSIVDIAYTLHQGRSHFRIRSAFVVRDKQALLKSLRTVYEDGQNTEYVNPILETDNLNPDALLKELGIQLIVELRSGELADDVYKEKLRVLAEMYVKGHDFEWEILYSKVKHHRISMPTYPFEQERYWIPESDWNCKPMLPKGGEYAAKRHPLLNYNTSNLGDQRFTSRIQDDAFYLTDHVVLSKPILPGAVYLEMVRAAGEVVGNGKVIKIKNMVWAKAITIPEKYLDVHVSLYPAQKEVEFEVTTIRENSQKAVHAHGKLVFADHASVRNEDEIVNIAAIKERSTARKSSTECYKFFKANGLNYGPSFQVIQELYCNNKEALAKLKLPAILKNGFSNYVLHPSIMDGAIQTLIGLFSDKWAESGKAYIPFALNEVEILRSLPEKCYSYVTLAGNQSTPSSMVTKFNIKVLDETGRVLIRMNELSVRGMLQNSEDLPGTEKIRFYTLWEKSKINPIINSQDSELVLIFDQSEELFRSLKKEKLQIETEKHPGVILVKPGKYYQELEKGIYEINPGRLLDYRKLIEVLEIQYRIPSKILHLWSKGRFISREETLKGQLECGMYSVLFLSQALMLQKIKEEIRLLFVYTAGRGKPEPQCSAVSGLIKTIRLENPKLLYKTIEMPAMGGLRDMSLLDLLLTEFMDDDNEDVEIRYEADVRWVKRFKEYEPPNEGKEQVPLKRNGVYLLTGGAGGLGLIIAEFLARQFNAKLILTGRTDLGAEQESKIEELQTLGSEVIYIKGDISNRNDVEEWMDLVKDRFKEVNGIIHCAGVVRDALLVKKAREEIEEVLASKVFGTVNLDAVTRDMKMDFMVMFSSLAGVLGNVGQSDYAYANSFLDNFAQWREVERTMGRRFGKTLSINWPLWKDGGMVVDRQKEEWLVKIMGIELLSKEGGWNAFLEGLSFPHSQFIFLEGNRQKIIRLLCHQKREKPFTHDDNDRELLQDDGKDLLGRTRTYLKEILSKEIKLPVSRIEEREPLEKFGIDSVMIMKLTSELEQDFGELSKTLFFEYQSISELALYFIENHRMKLIKILGNFSEPGSGGTRFMLDQEKKKENEKDGLIRMHRDSFLKKSDLSKKAEAFETDAVAIIGVSGQYPMARDINEFWENLKAGKDCITEIPKERWDYHKFYNPDKSKMGNGFSKWGGFISDVDKFDPKFFNISPREAEIMDPQERIFLETVWHTLEDAGYTRFALDQTKVGVFVGVMWGQYQLFGADSNGNVDSFAPSSSYGSIANRISYYFNFHGPSIALDTMCSSSLTAIHLACKSMQNGECEMAVAGGVNVSIHPNKYVQLSQGKFTSSDGRCRSFGEGGDGYVPGEGVGAILLKHLDKAIRDGDHIYAVVKGSAINHGGKTNGYSVPNPKAQEELISEALHKSRVDPGTINYIEAHGTGTPLGDPIEITGLIRAYKGKVANQSCPIGSVKSNIGHLESAAGIAGVTKVLLQMMHKQLVPSIHSEKLNPNINFDNSPFYVQRESVNWKQPVLKENGKVHYCPRRAGISSFGAGGSNAHLILEEYEDLRQKKSSHGDASIPRLIVLSALNEERLRVYAEKMATFIKNTTISLDDLAYTLQVGREPMSERLSLVVSSTEELVQGLTSYAQGKTEIRNLYHGNIKFHKHRPELLLDGEEGHQFMVSIIQKRKLYKLAELWVSGVLIDWELLYSEEIRNRISLPTYPFSRQRYWVPKLLKKYSKLHPLIDCNTSNLKEQRFTTRFMPDAFYLSDHVVMSKKVLPGVVYLEMARAAGELAGERQVVRIKGMVWAKPITIEATSLEVQLSLYPIKGEVAYEVSTMEEENKDERMVHAKGRLVYEDAGDFFAGEEGNIMDIQAIQDRCQSMNKGADCYELLKGYGLEYGPRLQVIETLFGNEREALACLALPSVLENEFHDFGLHPALMDGLFQTMIGVGDALGKVYGAPYLPFELGELTLLRPLPMRCYAYVCLAEDQSKVRSDIRKFNIWLLNEEGQIHLMMKDVHVKALPQHIGNTSSMQKESPVTTMYYKMVWEQSSIDSSEEIIQDVSLPLSSDTMLLFDTDSRRFEALKNRLNLSNDSIKSDGTKAQVILVKPGNIFRSVGDQIYEINPESKEDYVQLIGVLKQRKMTPDKILHLWSDGVFDGKVETITRQLDRGVYSVFYLTQALLKQSPDGLVRLLYIYTGGENNQSPQYAATGGLIKSISMENPRFVFKAIEFQTLSHDSSERNYDQLWDAILPEFQSKSGDAIAIRYEAGRRWVRHLQQFNSFIETDGMNIQPHIVKLKSNGVYLITGGLGGLGLLFAEYLAREFKAKLVLTGRSEISNEKQSKLYELEKLGSEVMYIKADISNRDEVMELIRKSKERFKGLNGIIHSAGVIRDTLVMKKTRSEMQAVLASKVYGTMYLDEATRDEKLDFLVLFSSITSVMGNVGQCDYAFGNSFMDYFASMREHLRTLGKRTGKTLSINWPIWRDGGMKVDEQTEIWFARTMGMRVLDTKTGLEAFNNGLSGPYSQFMVITGNNDKVSRVLGVRDGQVPRDRQELSKPAIQASDGELLSKMRGDFMLEISNILKIPEQDIGLNDEMSEFGFDSVSLTELANHLNEKYSLEIMPSIFFEYTTFSSFTEYLLRTYREDFVKYYHGPHQEVRKEYGLAEKSHEKVSLRSRFLPSAVEELQRDEGIGPIAIVGMSGIMPGSEDLDCFWEHLEAGHDLISEIPKDRWDWNAYYGDPTLEANKTNVKWGGFMKEVDKFDASFFGISPREAELMDPQQRLFLETVWKTIEDAGYKVSDISGTKTGVFVGVASGDYREILKENNIPIVAHAPTGVSHSILANRISYLFNLHGPSEPIDTACSSSLVAIHRAVEAMHSGNCNTAIVGGVNVILSPTLYIAFNKAGMLSEDGKCRTFDKHANGYVRGEGCGAVWLKPLKQAEIDGDHIYAVIKGTSENHGGRASSLTAPNPNAQADLIVNAYEKANVDPVTISYIETHGTGTVLGDPVEVDGLKKGFKELYARWNKTEPATPHCGIGAVKTNVGHLETAAGIAGIFKVLLSLKHKKLPATIHFEEQNPYIQLKESPFYIVNALRDWSNLKDDHGRVIPRRAGVSSFGFGGSNAHVVLEEYIGEALGNNLIDKTFEVRNDNNASSSILPGKQYVVSEDHKNRPLVSPGSEPQVFIMSAKNNDRLKVYADNMVSFLKKNESSLDLIDITYTLQVGRKTMESRLALVVSSIRELISVLEGFCQGDTDGKNIFVGEIRPNQNKTDLPGENEAEETLIKMMINKRAFSDVAKLWVSGREIDWKLLYSEQSRQRVSLPTYPFEKKRYWFDSYRPDNPANAVVKSGVPLNSNKKPTPLLYNGNDFTRTYQGNEVILKWVDENIAIVIMQDRQNKNMFSENMIMGLLSRFSEIQRNENTKAVILTGYDNIFCMGGTQDALLNIAERKSNFTDVPFLYKGLLECEIPVITAMQGHASGGGLLFGLYGDIIVMSEEGIYSSNFTQYGFTPGMGATFILKDKLGSNIATEMMFTAKSFQGKELQKRGASFIFRKNTEVLKEALVIAKSLSQKPLHTLKVLKKNMAGKILEQLPAIVEDELNMHEQTMQHPEVKERIERYFHPTEDKVQPLSNYSTCKDKDGMEIKSKIILKPKDRLSIKSLEEQKTNTILKEDTQKCTIALKQAHETKPELLAQIEKKPICVSVSNNSVQNIVPDQKFQMGNGKKEDYEAKIADIVSNILHLPDTIDKEVSLKDLGVDSIGAVEIVRDINSTFSLSLEAIALYEYSTIPDLARYVYEESIKVNKETQKLNSVEDMTNEDKKTLDILRRLEKGELKVEDVKQMMEVR